MKRIGGKQYKVTSINRKLCSIDDYVEDCGVIWIVDPERPVSDLYYHVVTHASALGEAIRRELYDDVVHQLGRLTIWLFSLVKKLQSEKEGIDRIFTMPTPLSEMIWNKYPNCCHACFGREYSLPLHRGEKVQEKKWTGDIVPCTCLLHLAEVERRSQRLSLYEKRLIKDKIREYAKKNKPVEASELSLDKFQERFQQIFAPNLFATSIESIAFHLLEEIGEVSEALSSLYTYKKDKYARYKNYLRKRRDLENEIADVFSWIFALANKLRDIFSLPDRYFKKIVPDAPLKFRFRRYLTLSQIIWETYGNKEHGVLGCRDCKKLVCGCPIYLVNSEEKVNSLLQM